MPRPNSDADLYFVHDGRAQYPEIRAYQRYFADRFATAECDRGEVARIGADAIWWHMMGFYPRAGAARLAIHDYRSLSIGRARGLKDRVKAVLNHRPDLRIFQNEDIRAAMRFTDGVPHLLLPMGVPDDIVGWRTPAPTEPVADFCYAGSMLPERRLDRMIASFLRRYGSARTLWLYGTVNPDLQTMFAAHPNIVFAGSIPQERLFERLGGFRACVCYFPNHHPHVLQTPTKLLEYAALGRRIIANEHPQSRIAARDFGIACQWGSADDMFADAPDAIDWPDNRALDVTPMLWSSVIRASGIDAALAGL